jgi:hypothetical protein
MLKLFFQIIEQRRNRVDSKSMHGVYNEIVGKANETGKKTKAKIIRGGPSFVGLVLMEWDSCI